MIIIEKCDWCDEEDESVCPIKVFFSPWDEEPNIINLCENCEENAMFESYEWCEHCHRLIAIDNGMRKYIRYYEDTEAICVRCLQEKWFEYGMPRKVFETTNLDLDGDFFNYNELTAAGFTKIDNYAYGHGYSAFHGYDDIKKCKRRALELIDEGRKVIVDIQASGMGIGGYFGLWASEVSST